jgi:hypothetical protein
MRLLLETSMDGFTGVIPFLCESVDVAKAEFSKAVQAAAQIQREYKYTLTREGAYLRELRAQMSHYALDEISDDLKDKIRKEMERTSTKNFPRPSTEFQFCGITLNLETFQNNHEGYVNVDDKPEIKTIDELFAEVESQ